MKINKAVTLESHPCFSKAAHGRYGRIHLPVAPRCNVQCNYCVRRFDCVNESRPGVTSRLLSVSEAVDRVARIAERDSRISVIGIAGPGDPLANENTFSTIDAIGRYFPDLHLCISTNGLLLPQNLDRLVGLGISSITVTINAVEPSTAARIYKWVRDGEESLEGVDGARLLLDRQWEGLRRAAALEELLVKVNFVLVPGVNDGEVEDVAFRAGQMGVDLMNIIPMKPQGGFAHLSAPGTEDINEARKICATHVTQMRHCRQCRADAIGRLGEDRDADTETILSRIGEEYCEYVC